MRICKSALAICGAVLLALSTSVEGDAAASRSYVTFNAPVTLPGVTLASGTYVFERIGVSQDLVRVTNKDNHIVYLTAFTNEVPRPAGAGLANDIVLGESLSGVPRPIRVWFPEHSRTGREFIYR